MIRPVRQAGKIRFAGHLDLSDVGLLPGPVQMLPRVDLTRNHIIDYLALREVLAQAGSRIAGAAARAEAGSARARVTAHAGETPLPVAFAGRLARRRGRGNLARGARLMAQFRVAGRRSHSSL